MRETVYEHIGGDETMTITAEERWSVNMIRKLKAKYPDKVTITYENYDGSLVAHMPAEWMRIVPKREINLTEERRNALAERMRQLRKSQK